MYGEASAHPVNSNSDMGDKLSPGVPPISHQQSLPHTNQSALGQSSSSTRPSAPVQNHLAPPQDVPGSHSGPPHPPSSFTTSLLPYPSPPPFRHGTSYAGRQYALSQARPPLHMVHSSPSFVFSQHSGAPEEGIQHLVPMFRQHGPVYPFQGSSSDPTSSPHQTYAGTTATALHVYPHTPVSPSPSPHSPFPSRQGSSVSTASLGEMQRPTLYPSPGTYSPVGYMTPPPFVYPSSPFAPAAPSIYGSHYPLPHYAQLYGSPPKQEDQGLWWYVPPGTTTTASAFEVPPPPSLSQLSLAPSLPLQQHEDEQPDQSRTETQASSPSPTGKFPSRSQFGDPVSQIRTTENPRSSKSRRHWRRERRSYHPKLPENRSEWVMWAGNVPSDATCDELRDFFNQPLSPQSPTELEPSTNPKQIHGGVSSVFLIARSNCAFINFESEAQLEAAIARFHGQSIRTDDARRPSLVCRIRKRTDDLKAGVGAQRGSGMHVKWIKEQRTGVSSGGGYLAGLSDDDTGQRSSTSCSSRSGSFASTDSDVLLRYFPQRYFILKSLSQHDLDLSVQRNIWATQEHNEEILDRAYRTSKEVFLIFSVNKSGEFYGYARFALLFVFLLLF
ncbi:hypothetical protein BJV74DRAFT_301252 [Russula compacta]|nr:hypothetical protein BJV74DRAFT_301252 [Russula compacta]